MSDDSDNFEFSDSEIDNKTHDKLVEDVLNLNKNQNVKKPSRTEPTSQISEFNLVKSLGENRNLVHINDLTKLLKGQKKHVEISNKVKSTNSKSTTLPTPLEKPQANLIKRTLNYEKSRLQLDRWESLVTANRAASNLVFPLGSVEKVKIEEKRAERYPSSWRVKSDLQKELEKLNPKVEEFRIDTEEKEEYPLTLDELKQRRKEMAKLRAHQSYKEAKARRQNKIKSKKYHRILKREKIKQQLKEFEQLQKTNPEEALRKLDDIEKARAEERFNLRHKGTGQWAKNKQIRAKYDKESRKELAQQLAISRDLTQKVKPVDSESEDEGIELAENMKKSQNDGNNPWVNGIKPNSEVTDFLSGYKKFWNEHNNQSSESVNNSSEDKANANQPMASKKMIISESPKRLKKSSRSPKVKSAKTDLDKTNLKSVDEVNLSGMNSSFSTSEWEVTTLLDATSGKNSDVEDVFEQLEDKLERKLQQKSKTLQGKKNTTKRKQKSEKQTSSKKYKVDLSFPTKAKRPIIDESMMEQTGNIDDEATSELNPDLETLKNILGSNDKKEPTPNKKPNECIEHKEVTELATEIPDLSVTEENEDSTDQQAIMMEVFEDDDTAADFQKEKAAEIEKDTPKNIDLNLPGWGSWAGGNIDPNKRKRKRFIFKVPKAMPRKDDNKGSLIINEKAQSKIKPLLVSEVPFPFKSVKDYEASIRAPIGNTFVPETAFRKLIEPAVTTKMGAIIEPIDKHILCGIKKI
ncbi:U3 small nucleolar RNA-associated protein 14 homolog C [Leptinotarsa decemlineata]|uniref:U3 small nucleolar RNA-associated protein 14 homolog C n=1 Tax=Leptinotarsa decemlineata TaxID=7539 RepID=UPI003D309540